MKKPPINPEHIQGHTQNLESTARGEEISKVVGETRKEANKHLKRRRLRYSKRGEIEEGYMEYLSSPSSKEGLHPKLADSFEIETTETPLRRQDIEKEVESYVDENFKEILPVLLSSQVNHGELIKQLGLTNEQIGLLGANYYIREENGEPAIFQTDEYNPEGRRVSEDDYGINSSDLLALAYARDAIRTDTQNEANRVGGKLSHRYYLKSQDRYLCKNDFGMRAWDEEEGKMAEGKTDNVAPFIQTIKQQLARIQENLSAVRHGLTIVTHEPTIQEKIREIIMPDYDDDFSDLKEYQREVEKAVSSRVAKKLLQHFEQNPGDKRLVLESVPIRKVSTQLHFQYDRIARKYDLIGGGTDEDYQKFKRYGHKKIEKLVREPSDEEKTGTSLQFAYSDLFKKPVIVQYGLFNRESLIAQAKGGVRDVLANRAAQADPQMQEVYTRYLCRRGEQSPYFYNDSKIYDFIQLIGIERASEILDQDDRNVSEQMTGFRYLEAMGYDSRDWEPARLKKQLYEAYKLRRSNVWGYLQKREQEGVQQEHRATVGDAGWLSEQNKRKSRALFREGKRMYWLAQQVFIKNPNHSQEDRFYHYDSYVDWGRYDLSKADVPDEKLNEHLDKHKNLIVALLEQGQEQNRYGEQVDETKKGKGATLGLIIQALEKRQDLRGVALAHDKERYLEGLIKGELKDDLEFALADWPQEWRKAVTQGEVELYYDYANDYVQLDPNGLTKYAKWRSTTEGKTWNKVFEQEPSHKSELDFRICLGAQTKEVRGWYRGATEYVGGPTVQDYLLRFNATRDTENRLANWHDVLFWVPNIRKLEAVEAKSILSSIQTMDDNQEFIALLPRYSKERDPLTEHGKVQSIRELKKRIFAIESNIDLSEFPPEVIEITTAPGFNVAALESMRRRSDFHDLVEGKMDKEQPFKPHRRIFAGRDLCQALQEGLGSRKLKVEGAAQSVRKLFHELNQLIKGKTIGKEGRKMQVNDLFDNIPVDMEEEIIRLLQEQRVNVGSIIEAQIHSKSDPEGWVCGNYTDCCMPFGASNNTGYMFNPSTQYFTIKYNGRIVAQSVVVDGVNSKDNSDVVILDNIEVANNYKKLSPALARAYQVFWTEYTSKPVKVGTGYSDLIPPGGKLEQNNYRSKTSLSYSDARGSQIYDMPKMRGIESLDEVVTFANLTERDAELIAKMEETAYPEGMTQGKAHILDIIKKQRELDVPGAASSFVIRQGDEAAGYLLVLPEESEVSSGERVAHIHDMVVLPKFQGTGLARKMMERVLDVATAYNVSIEAEARASTSYALLMNNRVRAWLESRGFYLTKNEKLPEYLGDEDFYFVRFENKQNVAE